MSTINNGHRGRLRDRFFTSGLDALKPHEVLELILFTVYPRRDTKQIAKNILEHFDDDLHKVLMADKEHFKDLDINDNAIALIKLLRELNIYVQKIETKKKKSINSSNDVYEFLNAYYKGLQKEEFFVIYLDAKNKIINMQSEFKGTINEARIYIREIAKKCLLLNAAAVILSHNHPSGSIQPSDNDVNITLKIQKALQYLDIKLIDHLIIADNDFYSFREYGVL